MFIRRLIFFPQIHFYWLIIYSVRGKVLDFFFFVMWALKIIDDLISWMDVIEE